MTETPLLVATDLDGTLLDEQTYSHAPARAALRVLAERGVPLVLCSSKTRAELEALARTLDYRAPLALIVENGGALVVPIAESRETPEARRDGEQRVVELGARRASLVASLAALAAETGARLRGFEALSAGEIEALTGLTPDGVRLAQERRYDEPFLLEDDSAAPEVAAAARRRGLRVTRGGRFFHLTGATDKGLAFRRLLTFWPAGGTTVTTVGLGDSENDLPLLLTVERPILVPRPGGRVNEALAAALPAAERAPQAGPVGWNAALLAVLRGERLAPVADTRAAAEPT